MATCVALTEAGTLVPTGQEISDCAGYVLVSPNEAVQLTVLETLFDLPTPEAATGIFSMVVVSIIGAFLTGRAFGKPANLMR